MTIGQSFGMSSDAALKLGGAIGIAGVAVNTWIKNWDDAKELFKGQDWVTTAERKFYSLKDAILSAGAALANPFTGGVRQSQADLNRAARGKERQEATRKENEEAARRAETVVSGVDSDASRARANAFREALEAYGGGERLRLEMSGPMEARALEGVRNRAASARARGDTTFDLEAEQEKARKQVREAVNAMIAAAIEGTAGAAESVLAGNPALNKLYQSPEARKALEERQRQELLEAEGARNTREFERREREKEERRRDQEAARIADALAGGAVGRGLLAGGDATKAENLDSAIQEALEKAGMGAEEIGKLLPEVAKKLREEIDRDIAAEALRSGLTYPEAQAKLAKEADERAEQSEGMQPKAEVMSTEQYLNRILTAGLAKPDKEMIPRDQLAEQKTTNEHLVRIEKALADKGGGKLVATFAGKRGAN